MIKQYTAILAMLFMVLSASAKNKEHSGKINITPISLEQKGDSIYLEIIYDIIGSNVDSRRSLNIFPYLVTSEKRFDFPMVMVKGCNNYKVYKRQLALMSRKQRAEYNKNAPYAVVKGYKKKQHTVIEYNKAIPYETWMADAKLNIQKDIEGCGRAPRTLAMSELVNRIKMPYTSIPVLVYSQPKVEIIKSREMEGEAFLDFVVSTIDIRPDYMNNPRELKKITDMIDEVKSDTNIIIKSISVIGYASPEGSFEFNRYLSEGRANALIDYLNLRFDFPKSLYKIEFGGENWVGLREAIVASNMAYKTELLDIIDNVPVEINYKENSSRKKTLMTFEKGTPYRYMLKEIYPSLRKAICKIGYEIKDVTVVDAKELIKTKPENLSLNEMFLVANTYEKGSPEFLNVFEIAIKIFPNDPTANLNAAVAALSKRDIATAERYLNKIEGASSAEYNNAMGALLMLKGEFNKAESFLQKAADMGLDAAKTNLTELKKRTNN